MCRVCGLGEALRAGISPEPVTWPARLRACWIPIGPAGSTRPRPRIRRGDGSKGSVSRDGAADAFADAFLTPT